MPGLLTRTLYPNTPTLTHAHTQTLTDRPHRPQLHAHPAATTSPCCVCLHPLCASPNCCMRLPALLDANVSSCTAPPLPAAGDSAYSPTHVTAHVFMQPPTQCARALQHPPLSLLRHIQHEGSHCKRLYAGWRRRRKEAKGTKKSVKRVGICSRERNVYEEAHVGKGRGGSRGRMQQGEALE